MGIEPRFLLPSTEGVDVPAALLGVPREGAVVDLQPLSLVAPGLERPGRELPRFPFDRQRPAQLQQVAAPYETDRGGDLVVHRARLGDPQVDVPSALAANHVEGGAQEVLGDRRAVLLLPVVRVDHELQGPALRTTRNLGVAHGVAVARLPRHQPGEALAAPLHEIEPLVLAQRTVAVGGGGHVEQLGDGGDITFAHLPLDLDAVHRATLPATMRRAGGR